MVSIPFKREGTFRRILNVSLVAVIVSVSIPFKREGTFRPKKSRISVDIPDPGFQFPSNGKAHSDKPFSRSLRNPRKMFQFPSNGKAHSDPQHLKYCQMNSCSVFQFPSNGKAHSDILTVVAISGAAVMFQFPSNGKAHSDEVHKENRS